MNNCLSLTGSAVFSPESKHVSLEVTSWPQLWHCSEGEEFKSLVLLMDECDSKRWRRGKDVGLKQRWRRRLTLTGLFSSSCFHLEEKAGRGRKPRAVTLKWSLIRKLIKGKTCRYQRKGHVGGIKGENSSSRYRNMEIILTVRTFPQCQSRVCMIDRRRDTKDGGGGKRKKRKEIQKNPLTNVDSLCPAASCGIN